MKFLIPLLATSALAAASTPTKRQQTDAQIAQAALQSITAANVDVQNGLAAYTPGAGINDPLAGTIANLIGIINAQTDIVNAIGVLNFQDSISLTQPTIDLADGTDATIDATIDKKPLFVTDCIATFAYQLLLETRTAAQAFSAAIRSKIDPTLQPTADTLIARIDASFQRGIDAYADQATPPCSCDNSQPQCSSTTLTTSTTTSDVTSTTTSDVTSTTTSDVTTTFTTTSGSSGPTSTSTTSATSTKTTSTSYGWENWSPVPSSTTTPGKPTTTPGKPTTTSEKPHPTTTLPGQSYWSEWQGQPTTTPVKPVPTTPVPSPPVNTTPYTTYKPTATTSKSPISSYTGAAVAISGNMGAAAVVAAIAALL